MQRCQHRIETLIAQTKNPPRHLIFLSVLLNTQAVRNLTSQAPNTEGGRICRQLLVPPVRFGSSDKTQSEHNESAFGGITSPLVAERVESGSQAVIQALNGGLESCATNSQTTSGLLPHSFGP